LTNKLIDSLNYDVSCRVVLQTYRHDMTYSVLKVPLNPNQPTNHPVE